MNKKCQPIGGVTLCRECDAMYWGTPDTFVENMQEALLPCGHKIHSIIFSGAAIKSAFLHEQLYNWLERNALLADHAYNAIRAAGGSFDENNHIAVIPPRNLEPEDYGLIAE